MKGRWRLRLRVLSVSNITLLLVLPFVSLYSPYSLPIPLVIFVFLLFSLIVFVFLSSPCISLSSPISLLLGFHFSNCISLAIFYYPCLSLVLIVLSFFIYLFLLAFYLFLLYSLLCRCIPLFLLALNF